MFPPTAYIRAPSMNAERVNRARVRAWRRGFREADLIFGPFADKHAQTFTETEMIAFEALLLEPDLDVYEWILQNQETPLAFETPLMQRLRAFAQSFRAGAESD